MDNKNLKSNIVRLLQEYQQIQYESECEFPSDVPNKVCNHAFIQGMSIENSFQPKVGDFNHLFSTPLEDIYIWTYRKDTYSALVSVVNPEIKKEIFWKTMGRLVQLSFSIAEEFESSENPVDYK